MTTPSCLSLLSEPSRRLGQVADRPQVGVAEAGSVFQPVAQAPVEGGTSHEDQRHMPEDREAGQNTGDGQHGRQGIAVDRVVKSRARLFAHKVADEAEVRRKEQDGEYPDGSRVGQTDHSLLEARKSRQSADETGLERICRNNWLVLGWVVGTVGFWRSANMVLTSEKEVLYGPICGVSV
jgi:hypothetical protein